MIRFAKEPSFILGSHSIPLGSFATKGTVYEIGRGRILSLAAAASREVPLLRIFVACSEPSVAT
jgi:hypothetical protein